MLRWGVIQLFGITTHPMNTSGWYSQAQTSPSARSSSLELLRCPKLHPRDLSLKVLDNRLKTSWHLNRNMNCWTSVQSNMWSKKTVELKPSPVTQWLLVAKYSNRGNSPAKWCISTACILGQEHYHRVWVDTFTFFATDCDFPWNLRVLPNASHVTMNHQHWWLSVY